MMTEEQLAAIEGRLKLATAGPWMQAHHIDEPRAIVAYARRYNSLLALDSDGMAIVDNKSDAALIAHAPDDLAALVAEVRRLRALVQPCAASEVA